MASPSGPRSGKHAYVNGYNAVRNWNLNWNQAVEARLHSASRGGPVRYAGVEDWNGSFEGFGGNPGMFPGDEVALKLFAGPSDGVYGSTGEVWEGNAIIDSLTLNWSWQPSQSLNWSATFSANGCLSQAESEYYDTPAACAAQMCALDVTYQNECGAGSGGTGDEGVFTTWANVESATLTFTAANQAFINSSTNCCTERNPGTIDWTLSVVDQEQYPILSFGTYYRFRLYITASTYWSVAFGLMQAISNIRADIETGAIMTKSNDFAMSAYACCDATPTLGEIENPSGGIEWPIAAV